MSWTHPISQGGLRTIGTRAIGDPSTGGPFSIVAISTAAAAPVGHITPPGGPLPPVPLTSRRTLLLPVLRIPVIFVPGPTGGRGPQFLVSLRY